MSDDEKKGYARGYIAGRKRMQKDIATEQRQSERQAFLERAFLAALPACVDAQGWSRGTAPISSMDARVQLAWDFATQALKQRRFAP